MGTTLAILEAQHRIPNLFCKNITVLLHKSLQPDVVQNQGMAAAIQARVYQHKALQQQAQLTQKTGINLPENPLNFLSKFKTK